MAQAVPGSYLGQTTTGMKQPIMVNPATGQIDINALIQNMVDRRKKYFYDTIKFAPGATVSNTPYGFYSTALNQPDQYNGNIPKTMLETNMRTAQMFNPPYDLIINNLGFLFNADVNAYDLTQFVKLCWFEFKILEKTMWEGSLLRHPPGAGVSGFSTHNHAGFWNNGVPNPGDIWWFGDYRKYIPPLVNFSLTLNFPETLNTYYNSVLPANVTAVGTAGTSLPTLLANTVGGNGIQLQAWMNGYSDGPVQ